VPPAVVATVTGWQTIGKSARGIAYRLADAPGVRPPAAPDVRSADRTPRNATGTCTAPGAAHRAADPNGGTGVVVGREETRRR